MDGNLLGIHLPTRKAVWFLLPLHLIPAETAIWDGYYTLCPKESLKTTTESHISKKALLNTRHYDFAAPHCHCLPTAIPVTSREDGVEYALCNNSGKKSQNRMCEKWIGFSYIFIIELRQCVIIDGKKIDLVIQDWNKETCLECFIILGSIQCQNVVAIIQTLISLFV